MIADYHVHTQFSGDSQAAVEDQIERAIGLGMAEICFTDHHDYDVVSDIDFNLDLPAYVSTITEMAQQYRGRIRVKLGIELGLQPHLKEYLHEAASAYPFDFIIGSTHFVDGIDPYFPVFFEGRSEKDGYRDYFHTLLTNIRELDDYDVVGHIDYIVRYGPNKNRDYSYEAYRDVLDQILKSCVEKGKGIECNSAGFRKGLGQPNPHGDILKEYRRLGGEVITVGSDAHYTEDLGADFSKIRELLLDCGFSYYTTFERRKPEFHRL